MIKTKLAGTIFILALIGVIFLGHSQYQPSQQAKKYTGIIEATGQWFVNNQSETFLRNRYDIEGEKYFGVRNYIRELGSLWAISKLSNFSDDTRFKELANRGMRYFEQYFKYDEANDFYYLDVSPPNIKLGYSAFIILTLLEIEYPNKGYYLEKFANGILKLQNPDGSFKTNFKKEEDIKNIDHDPGQALFALASLYNHTKNRRYLFAVQKAFPYYVRYFRENNNKDFIPWQTRAYYLIYNNTFEKEVAGFIFEMNDYLLSEYNHEQACKNYSFEGSGMELALYTQSAIFAEKLASEINDKERGSCYKQFILEAINYLMTLRITTEQATAPATIGGFISAPDSSEISIDNMQNALILLLDTY